MVGLDRFEHCLELIIGEGWSETGGDEGLDDGVEGQDARVAIPLHATFQLTNLGEALATGHRVIYVVTMLVLSVEKVA